MRRFGLLAVGVVLLISGWPHPAAATRVFSPAGHLTWLESTPSLGCSVIHKGSWGPVWYPGSALAPAVLSPLGDFRSLGGSGACGAAIAVDGVLYGPEIPQEADGALGGWDPYGRAGGPWFERSLTPVSQAPVSGTGVASDPFVLRTVARAGETGIEVARTDTYVESEPVVRSEIAVTNLASSNRRVRLASFGACGIGRVTISGQTRFWTARDEASVTCGWVPGGNYQNADATSERLVAEDESAGLHRICAFDAFGAEMASLDVALAPGCSDEWDALGAGSVALTWDDVLSPSSSLTVHHRSEYNATAISSNDNAQITGQLGLSSGQTTADVGDPVTYDLSAQWDWDYGAPPYALVLRLPPGAEYVPGSVPDSGLSHAPEQIGSTLVLWLKPVPRTSNPWAGKVALSYSTAGNKKPVLGALGWGVLYPSVTGPEVEVKASPDNPVAPESGQPPGVPGEPASEAPAGSDGQGGVTDGDSSKRKPLAPSGPGPAQPSRKSDRLACKAGQSCLPDVWVQAVELVQGPSGTRVQKQPRLPRADGKVREFSHSHIDRGSMPVASQSAVRVGARPVRQGGGGAADGFFGRWDWSGRQRAWAAPTLVANRTAVLRVFVAVAGGLKPGERPKRGQVKEVPVVVSATAFEDGKRLGKTLQVAGATKLEDPVESEMQTVRNLGDADIAERAINTVVPAAWIDQARKHVSILVEVRPVGGPKERQGLANASNRLWLRNIRPTAVLPSVNDAGVPDRSFPVVVRGDAGNRPLVRALLGELQTGLPLANGAVREAAVRGDLQDVVGLSEDLPGVAEAITRLACRLGSAAESCPRDAAAVEWRGDGEHAVPFFMIAWDVGWGAAALGSNTLSAATTTAAHEAGHVFGLQHAGVVNAPSAPLDWQDVATFDPIGSGRINGRYLQPPLRDDGGGYRDVKLPSAGSPIRRDARFVYGEAADYDHAQARAESDGGRSSFDTMSYWNYKPGFSLGQWNYLVEMMSRFRTCDPANVGSRCDVRFARVRADEPGLQIAADGGM